MRVASPMPSCKSFDKTMQGRDLKKKKFMRRERKENKRKERKREEEKSEKRIGRKGEIVM